jgi:hypothetical protein
MTTFQDPPLQSRRAVRQTERDQLSPPVVPTTGPNPTPAAPAAPGEPLTYATQARPSTPDYEGPGFRARRTPEPVNQADVPAGAAAQDDGTFRPRDYSPEARRSAAPTWAPQYGGAAEQPPAVIPADPHSTFAPHPPAAPVIMPSALDSDESPEHTLTRRELRALREVHGITAATTGETVYPTPEAPVAQAPVAPVAPAPVAPAPVPSTRLDSALAEFDQLAAGRPAPVVSDPPAARGRRAAAAPEPEAVAVAPAAPVAPVAPVAPAPLAPAPVAPPASAGPAQVSPDVVGPIPAPVPIVQPVAEPEIVIAEIIEPEPVVAEPSTSTPPTGHWSTQAQLDDETQFGDAQLARNIGSTSGAITTSALVLPSIPTHEFGPLSSGELMVTGSISLPASMSATGAHPAQLDESDLDHLLDPGDHQVASTDSQPVRAIKAVSTHTSSRGVIQTVKPKGNRGLTALIIAASGMAVVVGALFIVLVVTGQLG